MKYKINKGFIMQKMGGKSTIFDSEESMLYTFNNVGSIIFEKLKLGWGKKRIIGYIEEKYLIEKKMVTEDVDNFIKKMVKSKIFREV